MLLLKRVVAGFVEGLACIIILVWCLTYYHLAVLRVIVSLLPAASRFLVTYSYLIFLLHVGFLRLRRAFAALLGLYGQSTLKILRKLKTRHFHGF